MIPAGPERDKRIAILRGEADKSTKCKADLPLCYGRAQWGDFGCTCNHLKYAPYSTDITCAMELWEEMRGAGYVALSTLGDDDPLYCHLNTGNEIFDIQAETEADAISGAWLKWKDNGETTTPRR